MRLKKLNAKGFSHHFIIPVLAIVAVAGIGTYVLNKSKADNLSPVYVSTRRGCNLAGRIWANDDCAKGSEGSTNPCLVKTNTYQTTKGDDGITRGYCTHTVALSIDQDDCIGNLHRQYVNQVGCARRADQKNTDNAPECQTAAGYTHYVASGATDVCTAPGGVPVTDQPVLSAKDKVNAAYQKLWASGQSVANNWGGSISGCSAGNISTAARDAQLNAVNFVRTLDGLGTVTASALSSTAQANVQKAALMQDANNQNSSDLRLSHEPPRSWRCYSNAGADTAGRSNLAIAPPKISPLLAIKLYMDEPGSGNEAVGHRRWILNPPTSVMAFGMTKQASALTVIGLSQKNTKNPAWVQWPSDGYFPDTLEPSGRWSLSSGHDNASFAHATVTVKHNGSNVAVKRYTPDDDYAQPTLVWQMPSGFEKKGTYTVTVKGMTLKGSSKTYDTTYNVNFFTPY